MNFTAIDFETANTSPTSACSVGIVRVDQSQVVFAKSFLIRPPTDEFMFTYIHGLTWDDVRAAPTWEELWPEIEAEIRDSDFLVAHNASFDQRVLWNCCDHYGLAPPEKHFQCTVKIARKVWGFYPTKLSDVCRQLGIPLNHHEALSDASACAEIVLRAAQEMRFRGEAVDLASLST